MDYPKIPLAQSILQICQAKGVTTVVISPGSRNAPLTIGFASNPDFKCYSVADERCAAFFALGLAQQLKTPVALLCTSGSAVLNYYPAVAEAFYSQIPLVVISADRPQSKIDIGDGQTIRQQNVLKSHTLFCANLTEEASEENDKKINKAINRAISKKGPVHINAPFEEPLYETVNKYSVDAMIEGLPRKASKLSVKDIMAATNIWNVAKKKLILVGSLNPGEIAQEILEGWAKDPSIVVMTEVTSNLHQPTFASRIDTLITAFGQKEFRDFRPDVLITFGGMVVSKRIKAFLRSYKPDQHWHIDPLRAYDTFGALSHHFKVEPAHFFEAISPFAKAVKSNYSAKAAQLLEYRGNRHDVFTASAPYSDFTVYEKILSALPENRLLHISNSAAIRYAQLFPMKQQVDVFCNRGTSGIDGSSSTAVGASVASDKPTVLITGDIGFLYDSNALWNNYIPSDFKIVIVNNGGGGIFRILPGHSETPVFNTFFETSHHLTAENLAKMYGFNYRNAADPKQLESELNDFYTSGQKEILEVFTPEKENDKVLKDYFEALA
ncbi:2-succinyl-5-enolpyruvyl-6-hydroxy-3-cyclohexene-1-carboxylic-acid synthase [Flavobacterium silvaticum]|uniref:2-succinyl-5-enolpyruvyl-6-hydroxy-3-cyclohexene-1-carboxylate synthase n=1 Tax=Flavobacterium silvaticum TaxID=1852020 RepID=A0A972G1W7_9FLAO|nr:2-succinyl-5-enolpyruvyl-6-hydroxy-3-cyclohexene-1-carboxylic-acid synthase [Flavobacterium silvaticum]NMH28941.1 2-succinyl-5-enolpyruvyl-6-hydroxy-3-cyclohexene-1-carboxylic-acid synthase [Flavobacterium silvaticum]